MNAIQEGLYVSRNQRGAMRHARRVGQILPMWMMCTHSLDSLMWAKALRRFKALPAPCTFQAGRFT